MRRVTCAAASSPSGRRCGATEPERRKLVKAQIAAQRKQVDTSRLSYATGSEEGDIQTITPRDDHRDSGTGTTKTEDSK